MLGQKNNNQPKILLMITVSLAIIAVLTVSWFRNQNTQQPLATVAKLTEEMETNATPTVVVTTEVESESIQQTNTPIFQPVILDNPEVVADYDETGVIIFSMDDGIYKHLFVYHPGFFPLTRLTNNNWDDIHPALSRDGQKLAYASKQSGYWDIYILDLQTYQQHQITHSNQYDGFPTWSPDGKWIAFESYNDGNLDIFIQSIENPNTDPVQLTYSENADYAPNWSPDGRKILFTSLRTGDEEIWLADLDSIEQRFTNLSKEAALINQNANWAPQGQNLIWSTIENGYSNLYLYSDDAQSNLLLPGTIGSWSPSGQQIASVLQDVAGTKLGIFDIKTRTTLFPYTDLNGQIHGITWGNHNLEALLPLLDSAKESSTPADWVSMKNANSDIPADRIGLAQLQDVEVTYPYLLDTVNESFSAFRASLITKIGWDYLATLENAYTPITSPAPPEILDNWLSTGRAIQVSDVPISNNWLVTIREDINGKTYWRIFLRTIDQTGAKGAPLRERPWSFDLRTQGSPAAYEQGGNFVQQIPEGYWVDFTELASQYGWERLPSLLNWRTYYPGTQFNVYVFENGETLESALLEIYPPEALLPQSNNSVVPIRPTPTPNTEEEN